MKTIALSLLIFTPLLVACAPQSTATPAPTPALANTPPATATSVPTQTLAMTPTSINQADHNSMHACAEIVDAKTSNAGTFQIVFAKDEERPAGAVYSEFGFYDDAQHTTLSLWSEDTQQTLPYPLPADTLGPKISANHRWILFRRDVSQSQSEFWVIGADGKNEKRVGTVVLNDAMRKKYPDASFALQYNWIPNTNKFYYYVDASQEFGPLVFERFVIADAASDQVTALSLPPEVKLFRFAPNGSQLAFVTENELYMLDTESGEVQFTISVSLNNPVFSPDGKYLIDFTNEGVLRIDAYNGRSLNIPLKYTIMVCCPGGDGPYLRPLPNFKWVNNSTLLMSSLISDQQFVVRPFEPDPDGWTFIIWKVDITNGIAEPDATFKGDPDTVIFSADGKRLAFSNLQSGDQPRKRTELYLADLSTGEVLETISIQDENLPEFLAWTPDSSQYLYLHDSGGRTPGDNKIQELFLGAIGAEPVYLGNVEGRLPIVNWLDPNRFSLQMGICLIVGYETVNLIFPGPPQQVVNIVP